VNSKDCPLNLKKVLSRTGGNYEVTAIAAQLKRFSILFLYSLRNHTNGTKPTVKAVLAPFYGWDKLVTDYALNRFTTVTK